MFEMGGIQNTESDDKKTSEIYKTLGNRIRSIRDSRKESRKKFCSVLNSASKAPVDRNGQKIELREETLKKWELGENQVNLLWLPAICEIDGCDYSFLFGESECRTKDLQGVKDYTGLSEESIELLSKLSNDPDGIEIVQEIDNLILDRRIIRCLHDIRIISSGIMHSEITSKNASSIRAMLEVAILKLSTLSNQYAYDTLNAESAMMRVTAADTRDKTSQIY